LIAGDEVRGAGDDATETDARAQAIRAHDAVLIVVVAGGEIRLQLRR
jgi:hypothetical protein